MVILFDPEVRQFSAIDDRHFADKKSWIRRNRTPVAMVGGAVVGGAAMTAFGRAQAKRIAKENGYEPGSPEYKALMKRNTLIGLASGTTSGALLGYGTDRLAKIGGEYRSNVKKYLGGRKMKDLDKHTRRRIRKVAYHRADRSAGYWN